MIPSFARRASSLHCLKRSLRRDPVGLRFALGLLSAGLGLGLIIDGRVSPDTTLLLSAARLEIWGAAFMILGCASAIMAALQPVGVAFAVARFAATCAAIGLWSYLTVGLIKFNGWDATDYVFIVIIMLETWVLTHSMVNHNDDDR